MTTMMNSEKTRHKVFISFPLPLHQEKPHTVALHVVIEAQAFVIDFLNISFLGISPPMLLFEPNLAYARKI